MILGQHFSWWDDSINRYGEEEVILMGLEKGVEVQMLEQSQYCTWTLFDPSLPKY